VVPANGDVVSTIACLESVLASDIGDSRLLMIDDASPEGALTEALGRLRGADRVEVLRHDHRWGWPASANAGIAACGDRDVVLLSNDAVVPPGWLKRLITAAYTAPDIGTVTPFSNDASFVTYRLPRTAGIGLDRGQTIQFDRLAQRTSAPDPIEIPIGVRGCLFVKRGCLDAVGTFDAEIFAGGHGAEADFCLRARALGWRHVASPGLFVGRRGGIDPGLPGNLLMLRNEAILSRLYPTYPETMRSFLLSDPLAEARKRLDEARWRSAVPPGQRSVILIAHAHGGGVEQRVSSAAAAYRLDGLRPIVLRPSKMADGRLGVTVGDGAGGGFPDLRFGLPDEMPALLRLLRGGHPAWIEVHHLLGHSAAIYDAVRRLGIPYDVHIHDYALVCPRISLMGSENRYCGEPDLAGCEACIARNGSLTGEAIGVSVLRRRSASFLAKARRAIAPSGDTAIRMRRYFPALPITVVPHGDDTGFPLLSGSRGIVRICILGGIGPHKGFDVLLACARDAADRALGLQFLVVGDTTDDSKLLDTGRAHITGTYEPGEAVDLVRAQNASLGFVPSVWPETWSLTLTELWQAGLPVAAFDIGAPAERVRATGRGILLPLGLPPSAINDALLAAARRFGHE
jgi:GT2 family glycosyltransferase/glycosyltransferase involved in cell wall biosynthesis